ESLRDDEKPPGKGDYFCRLFCLLTNTVTERVGTFVLPANSGIPNWSFFFLTFSGLIPNINKIRRANLEYVFKMEI
ncbi:MAG: hypothetical protein ACE5IW_08905, partial [bacterium]